MKLSQAKAIAKAAITVKTDTLDCVPYLVSGAGIGKTSVVHEIAKELGIGCQILSLAQYDAGELAGWVLPNADGETMDRRCPDWMPRDGKGILFLDELPQAPVSNQNIAAQLVNERRIGKHHLPEGWHIIAAGNRMSDRAGTNNMPSHLKDRLMFLDIEADLEDTIGYYYSKRIDERIAAFLRFRPEWLHKFNRDENACPSPRSWERVATILKWSLDPVNQIEAIAGQVGRAATAEFNGFLKVYDVVPDIDKLIANPASADIPDAPDVQYAVCAALSAKMTGKNAKNIVTYLKRLPQQEFAAFVIKDAMNRTEDLKRDLKADASIREWIMSVGKNLIL